MIPTAVTRLDHREIDSQLGAGMSEVCLAEGANLDRPAAIKLFPAEFTYLHIGPAREQR